MSQPDASLPKFFEIESVWQGTTGGLSYDCESQTMRVRGEYLPREPRRPWYVAEGEGLAIPSSDNLRGKLRRNRAHPKAVVTPTQQEWGLLFTIAARVCIWGIRGTEDFFNICDGAGCRVEIEFADRILQTAISRGEHVAQWGLFDAACRVFVGESRLGILSRKVEPIWNHDYVDMAYSKFIPEAEDPSTAEILMELLDLWEKAVTPKGRSLPLTISDWESAASYWETQSDSKRQQLCKEVLASLAENNNVRAIPDQIRPWWTVVSRFDGPPCHVCGRQLRTEKSEQCFSCGADWHGNDPYKRNVPILNGGWAVWIFLSLLMCAFIVMAIAFAKRPFNTTQYAFCAFFACAAAACIVKGLLFCASRLEFSRANLKIQFAFRLLCIDWSMVKSARFEENRGKSKFLGSIFGGEIPVPVGGVIPNIATTNWC